MLIDRYRHPFQALQAAIDPLIELIDQGKLSASDVQPAQQLFQEQILPLELEQFDPAIASQLLSIQTEMSKQFRLLSTDIVFLKAARQSATATQRQAQIRDRLMLLKQYCQGVLGALEGSRE